MQRLWSYTNNSHQTISLEKFWHVVEKTLIVWYHVVLQKQDGVEAVSHLLQLIGTQGVDVSEIPYDAVSAAFKQQKAYYMSTIEIPDSTDSDGLQCSLVPLTFPY